MLKLHHKFWFQNIPSIKLRKLEQRLYPLLYFYLVIKLIIEIQIIFEYFVIALLFTARKNRKNQSKSFIEKRNGTWYLNNAS